MNTGRSGNRCRMEAVTKTPEESIGARKLPGRNSRSHSAWPIRCPPAPEIPAPPPSTPPVASRQGRGGPPDYSNIRAACPPSPKAAVHRPTGNANLVTPPIYAVTLRISPWLWFRIAMPIAKDGHFPLWAGFKCTAHEHLSFWCLLCTANVSPGGLDIIRRSSLSLRLRASQKIAFPPA